MIGKGSTNHNSRQFCAENVDSTRSHLNICYCNERIKEVYHKLFDEALERYNAKQKRSDRRIVDYYEKIRTGKQEKPFHEIIMQVGNHEDMPSDSENGKLAMQILDEYYRGFVEHNKSLHVFSAHLHMDEATPHIHIDFVPFITGSTRGLDTRVSLKQALGELGFVGESKQNTEWNQFIDSEKEHLATVMERYGIQRIDKGEHREHLSVLDYKKQERSREVAELTEQAQTLEQSNAEAQNAVDAMRESLEKVKEELSELTEDKNNIDLEIGKYVGEEWELPEPSPLMSAKNYRTKIAMPLVSKLKDVIRKFIVSVTEISKMWRKALSEKSYYANLCKNLEGENKTLRKDAKNFELIKDSLGNTEVQSILQKVEQEATEKERGRYTPLGLHFSDGKQKGRDGDYSDR